jgi:transcriptional regulator with XRE-family HTH domain
MNELADILAKEFEDHEYAHAYIQAHVLDRMAMQVYALRTQQGWTQAELAEKSGIGQGKISMIETGDFGSLTLKTLFKLAQAFDVAPVVQFCKFSETIKDVTELHSNSLAVPNRMADLHAHNGIKQLFKNSKFNPGLVESHMIGVPGIVDDRVVSIPTGTCAITT